MEAAGRTGDTHTHCQHRGGTWTPPPRAHPVPPGTHQPACRTSSHRRVPVPYAWPVSPCPPTRAPSVSPTCHRRRRGPTGEARAAPAGPSLLGNPPPPVSRERAMGAGEPPGNPRGAPKMLNGTRGLPPGRLRGRGEPAGNTPGILGILPGTCPLLRGPSHCGEYHPGTLSGNLPRDPGDPPGDPGPPPRYLPHGRPFRTDPPVPR